MERLDTSSEVEDSNFDLKAEIFRYLTHWKWLLFGAFIGIVLALIFLRYSLPSFQTEATMMILKEEQGNMVGQMPSGNASFLTFDNSTIENQVEKLRSKHLVERVVEDLDFNILYFEEGKVITVEVYEDSPIQLRFLSDPELVRSVALELQLTPVSDESFKIAPVSSDNEEVYNYGEPVKIDELVFVISRKSENLSLKNPMRIKILPQREVANDFIQRMEIRQKGQASDILSFSIASEVPEKSRDFLNSLMRKFNAEGVADKRQVAENTTNFIQERLRLISEELDSVEGGIADFKRENQIMDVQSTAGEYMEKSSMAENEIFRLETQAIVLEGIEDMLVSQDPYQLLPEGLGLEEGGLGNTIQQYNELILKRNTYLRSGTTRNPVVETLTEQLESLRKNVLANIEQIRNSLRIRIRELTQLDLQAAGQFSTFPGLEKGIRTIERQQIIKEQLYLFLLQRREESAISSAGTSPVAKVIDPAYTFTDPVGLAPWMVLSAGGVVGLVIPLLIIFGINYFDTKVHHKGDLHFLIKDIPFLGEIPSVEKESSDIIQLNDRSPLAESFRILRTNLAYLVQSRNNDKAEIIFVTSTIQGEGKTFISYNMARTLASTGKTVLAIGADIRNPKLHKFAGQPLESKGLTDYLHDFTVQPEEVVHSIKQENIPVDMVFSGAIPPNPAELLMNDRLEELINSQKKNYDFIIVDTAPTMIVTDTLLISQMADTTIYVTRAGYTEKKLLDFPKDLKRQGKLKGLAIVLNDVDYSKFSYGAKYGYAYGYGYGYESDEEKKGFFGFLKRPFRES